MIQVVRLRFGLAAVVILFAIGLMAAGAWALTEEEENNIKIYREAAPGVVNITSISLERDFFLRLVPREGTGSGAIIDEKGYILTNNHVIKDARSIEVTLSDGTKKKGRLVGTDAQNDLAVIQVDVSRKKLHPLPLGSSKDLMVGQKVLAIGNPFGLNETLTTGIISSLGRSIRGEGNVLIEDLIQTDAAINPGNSGGPLLDSDGRIIGINTAIFSPTGGSVGIGFAIPVDTAKAIIPDLIEKGYVSHPWLGIRMFPLLPGLAEALNLKVERGVMIVEVVQGGPADQAGLQGGDRMLQVGNAVLPVGGDIITDFEGDPIKSTEDLVRYIRQHRPGDRVRLRILRDGRFKKAPVTLGERPRS